MTPGVAQRREAGFTLIEMLVVLAILASSIGIVLAFAPGRTRALDLDSTICRVAQAAMTGRSLAIARGSPVLLSINPVSHLLYVDGVAPVAVPVTLSLSLLPPPEVPGAVAIRFNADGSASGGSVVLSDGRRRGMVVVAWLTGRVRIALAT